MRVGSVGIEYEERGEGEPLLLLHGLGCSASDWVLQMPALSSEYRVIAPSLRGFGGSDKPAGPCSIMQYASDMVALLDQLKIQRAHVLGHSMGGAVALQLAVAHPERLNCLIVVNAQPSFAVKDWRRYLMLLMRLMASGPTGMERMTRFLARHLFPHDHQAELRDQMNARYAKNDRRAFLAAINALAGWSVEAMVDRVATPTLVVAGEHDVTSVASARDFAGRLPNGHIEVVADSGHATPFDQHNTVNKLVMEFLSTTSWGRNTPRTDRRVVPRPDAAAPASTRPF
ncbi:MAG: alpha/beta fold hydrolase [Gammaproteobacteria bacterium]